MNGVIYLAVAAALLLMPGAAEALALFSGDRRASSPPPAPPVIGSNGKWRPPEAAAPYLTAIAEAEARHNLPHQLLARVLYQESHFRADIISGVTPSSRGAVGIAQLMPDTAAELGANPFDPFESIDAAAVYLAGLYDQFGDWITALAAYNWGMGNVRRKGIAHLPAESLAYASEILVDVGTFS